MQETITDKKLLKAAMALQRTEITEYHIYTKLAGLCKDAHNAEILRKIGEEEKSHALFWQTKTGKELKPVRCKVFMTVLKSHILGLTFTLKQMEKNEGTTSHKYTELSKIFPEVNSFAGDEAEHEKELLNMLDEERLKYTGSIVLGLNDALVELTGALAGFTLALGDTRFISMAGLVTGISASFSMAASEFLSNRADNDPRAAKSALYTGFTYIITVALLITPFLLIASKFMALAITLGVAIVIIFAFNYYLAVAKDLNFKKRFFEMAFISLGVAALSFGVGYLLNNLLGV